MSEEVSNKDVFNWAINNLENIPVGVYSASVYKTDTTHVIHLWDGNGNSFDFVCPRAEFVDAPQQENFYDAVAADTEMTDEQKEYWLSRRPTPHALDAAAPHPCQHDFGMLGICEKCGEQETPRQ